MVFGLWGFGYNAKTLSPIKTAEVVGCAADWPGTEESSKLLGEGVRTSAESECILALGFRV